MNAKIKNILWYVTVAAIIAVMSIKIVDYFGGPHERIKEAELWLQEPVSCTANSVYVLCRGEKTKRLVHCPKDPMRGGCSLSHEPPTFSQLP